MKGYTHTNQVPSNDCTGQNTRTEFMIPILMNEISIMNSINLLDSICEKKLNAYGYH